MGGFGTGRAFVTISSSRLCDWDFARCFEEAELRALHKALTVERVDSALVVLLLPPLEALDRLTASGSSDVAENCPSLTHGVERRGCYNLLTDVSLPETHKEVEK